MDIQKIMVIGAGQMGAGIAQVAAQSGFDVYLNDMYEQPLNQGMNRIEKLLARSVEKQRIEEEEKSAILNRLTPSTNLEDAAECDLVVEAVVEDMNVKAGVFGELDTIC